MAYKPSLVRKLIFSLFLVLVYVFVAGTLIALANGYLFNQQTLRFEQTGIINLSVEQEPVEVGINGVKRKVYKKSPITLSYLLPGYYTVDVQKEGYHAWVKSFYLRPGQVIINPFLTLFLSNTTPMPASEQHASQLAAFEPPVTTDLDIRGNELWATQIVRTYPFTTTSDTFSLVGRFSSPIVSAQWYPEKSNIIFQIENDIRITDRDGSNDIILTTLSSTDPAPFMVTEDGKTLIYQDGDQIYEKRIR